MVSFNPFWFMLQALIYMNWLKDDFKTNYIKNVSQYTIYLPVVAKQIKDRHLISTLLTEEL